MARSFQHRLALATRLAHLGGVSERGASLSFPFYLTMTLKMNRFFIHLRIVMVIRARHLGDYAR